MVEAGARLFPWNRFLRTKAGYFALAYVAPSPESIEMIEVALKTDPYASDLIAGLAVHNYILGNHRRANELFAEFAKLAPNSPKGKSVRAALETIGINTGTHPGF